MKRKVVAGLLTVAMVAVMTAGCGKSSGSEGSSKKEYTIGIEQFAEHGSLDNCREGFLKGLEAEGIKVKNGTLYLGFASRKMEGKDDKRLANILIYRNK